MNSSGSTKQKQRANIHIIVMSKQKIKRVEFKKLFLKKMKTSQRFGPKLYKFKKLSKSPKWLIFQIPMLKHIIIKCPYTKDRENLESQKKIIYYL